MVPETTNSMEDTKDIVFLTNVGFQRHSLEQREHLFQKLLNDHTPLVTAVKSTCSDFEVPKPQNLSRNLTSTNDLDSSQSKKKAVERQRNLGLV